MGRVVIIFLLIGALALAGWLAVRHFHPPLAQPASWSFFVVGDNHGPRQVYRELLQKAKAAGAAFVINVADVTDHGTIQELADVRKLEDEVGLTVYHVIGSHDIKTDLSRAIWRQSVGPAWQSFNRQGAHFVLLDNADRAVGFPADELAWLKTDLAGRQSKTTFLFYHRPFGLPLESIFGDDETPASRKTDAALRAILKATKPTMIFTGHVHTYLPYAVEGIPAYVTGGGGAPAQAQLGGATANFFHGLLVTVTKDGPTARLLKLDNASASPASVR